MGTVECPVARLVAILLDATRQVLRRVLGVATRNGQDLHPADNVPDARFRAYFGYVSSLDPFDSSDSAVRPRPGRYALL